MTMITRQYIHTMFYTIHLYLHSFILSKVITDIRLYYFYMLYLLCHYVPFVLCICTKSKYAAYTLTHHYLVFQYYIIKYYQVTTVSKSKSESMTANCQLHTPVIHRPPPTTAKFWPLLWGILFRTAVHHGKTSNLFHYGSVWFEPGKKIQRVTESCQVILVAFHRACDKPLRSLTAVRITCCPQNRKIW